MNRLVLVGGGSFIARHVHAAAAASGIDVLSLGHAEPFATKLRSDDVVVNFALDPAYRVGPYQRDQDCDLAAALACRDAGAFFIMLSTRRVYPGAVRWGAQEDAVSNGDETRYGQNKALTERGLAEVGHSGAVLRLSNIFGFEYDPSGSRRTFFGLALTSLRQNGRIVLDMHPDTRRDFLPVEACAQAILTCASQRIEGAYNIGCGFPIACGDIARWVLEGYGSGDVSVVNAEIRDEFYLNTGKWQKYFGPLIDRGGLRERCMELGRMLK